MATASILDWTVDDVAIWLRGNGYEQYTYLLCGNHRIDGKALLLLTETDFRTDPLNMQVDIYFSFNFPGSVPVGIYRFQY
jgi:hypothetical protein